MVCPYCVLGVGFGALASLGFSLPDSANYAWIGAVTVMTVYWFNDWYISKYGKLFKYQRVILTLISMFILSYCLIIFGSPTV